MLNTSIATTPALSTWQHELITTNGMDRVWHAEYSEKVVCPRCKGEAQVWN